MRIATTALARQELRTHYGGTFFGIGWAALRPLVYFGVLVVIFGLVVRVGEPRYPEFLLAGLLPWLFFQTAISNAPGSIRGRGDLLRLAAFPRAALPLATVASALVDLAGQLVVVTPLLLFAGRAPPLRLLALLPALVALVVMVAATALVVSGLTVRYRDMSHLVPLALFLGFYVLPVFYSAYRIHMPWQAVFLLNPVTVAIETFRSTLYGGPWPPAWALVWTTAVVTGGAIAAWRWFSSVADRFVAEA